VGGVRKNFHVTIKKKGGGKIKKLQGRNDLVEKRCGNVATRTSEKVHKTKGKTKRETAKKRATSLTAKEGKEGPQAVQRQRRKSGR